MCPLGCFSVCGCNGHVCLSPVGVLPAFVTTTCIGVLLFCGLKRPCMYVFLQHDLNSAFVRVMYVVLLFGVCKGLACYSCALARAMFVVLL